MQPLESAFSNGHERVLFVHDARAKYRAIIALHSTVLGPAVGGSRFWKYETVESAMLDALRLSRGMTYKNAAAGLPFGGGKAVILAPEGPYDREILFLAHGRAIEQLGGAFITGEDVGTSPADMQTMSRATRHAAGYDGRGGDPSPFTARGVLRAIHACAQFRWGSGDLRGRRIGIQGCGNVGSALARMLRAEGADLTLADMDQSKAEACARSVSGKTVSTNDILRAEVDILAPCALGSVLTPDSIATLNCAIIAGAANNQLAEDADADRIAARGILYAPDYVVNAGGVISGAQFVLSESIDAVNTRINGIYDRLLLILQRASTGGVTPLTAANEFALERLRSA